MSNVSSADISIRLRALEPEDLELIYRLENDTHFWHWGSTTVPYSRYAIRRYLEECQNDLFMDRQVRLVGVDERTGETVGLADLTAFDPKHQRAEMGLLIVPERQGQGLGRLLLDALEAYARQLPIHQIYATVSMSNMPAMRMFETAGYTNTSRLHDWLLADGNWTDAAVWQKTLL